MQAIGCCTNADQKLIAQQGEVHDLLCGSVSVYRQSPGSEQLSGQSEGATLR